MKRSFASWTGLSLVVLVLLTAGLSAVAQDFDAELTGFQVVSGILTNGEGDFTATLDPAGTTLSFTLTYSGLAGTPIAAHIHFARRGVNRGVMAFLCGGGGQTACPTGTGGTVTGTIVATDIIGPTAQGVAAGNFAGFLQIMESCNAYVSIHTTDFPGGEIRGQVKFGFLNLQCLGL